MKKNYLILILLLAGFIGHCQATDIFEIARKGTVEQARQLLKSDPKAVNAVNADGYTPLILATYRANSAVGKFLLENGAQVDVRSGMGTALMAAVVKNNVEMVGYLLEKKADPNLADGNGSTALIYAVMFKKPEIVAKLVKAGADPDHKDNRGQSAVDYAILANDDQLIATLKTK